MPRRLSAAARASGQVSEFCPASELDGPRKKPNGVDGPRVGKVHQASSEGVTGRRAAALTAADLHLELHDFRLPGPEVTDAYSDAADRNAVGELIDQMVVLVE